jgi:hypothetical protein
MKIWVDDTRPAPEGWVWCKTTNEACMVIACVDRLQAIEHKENVPTIELIDLDHDAGDYAAYGGDYIKVLEFMEEKEYNYPVRLHTMNPVGRENMRRIIQHNNWKEVF